MQLHGVPMDENDDKGQPPYPIVGNLSSDEVSNLQKRICLILGLEKNDKGQPPYCGQQ